MYGIEIVVQDDAAEMMEDNIDQIINLALTGGLLAIFILWGDQRSKAVDPGSLLADF